MKKIALVISCEHAVDSIPVPYQSLFVPFKNLLASHRGIDFGALAIAEHLAKQVHCDFIQATTSRLLVDCNKSINHPHCFSEVTRDLPSEEKQRILDLYYWPFRQEVMDAIKKHIEQGSQVWHLSVHSFTPVLHGIVRNADIGFLYDPRCAPERAIARQWKMEIQKQTPEYKIRMNYPYLGVSDGLTSKMRKIYTSEVYLGIEVESNQALTQNTQNIDNLKKNLAISLLKLLC